MLQWPGGCIAACLQALECAARTAHAVPRHVRREPASPACLARVCQCPEAHVYVSGRQRGGVVHQPAGLLGRAAPSGNPGSFWGIGLGRHGDARLRTDARPARERENCAGKLRGQTWPIRKRVTCCGMPKRAAEKCCVTACSRFLMSSKWHHCPFPRPLYPVVSPTIPELSCDAACVATEPLGGQLPRPPILQHRTEILCSWGLCWREKEQQHGLRAVEVVTQGRSESRGRAGAGTQ